MTKKSNCKACHNLKFGIKTRKSFPHTCGQDSDKVIELMKGLEVIKSGYAGVLPNGNIVDRREHPKAIAIPANPLFGTPKPQEVAPCNLDHNSECLICDCWPSDCAWRRMKNKDYTYESKEELEEMFKDYYQSNG